MIKIEPARRKQGCKDSRQSDRIWQRYEILFIIQFILPMPEFPNIFGDIFVPIPILCAAGFYLFLMPSILPTNIHSLDI
ncbi:MAG: hypothetical protein ACXWWA_06360, partial [Chitinophagaceae bacterium]